MCIDDIIIGFKNQIKEKLKYLPKLKYVELKI